LASVSKTEGGLLLVERRREILEAELLLRLITATYLVKGISSSSSSFDMVTFFAERTTFTPLAQIRALINDIQSLRPFALLSRADEASSIESASHRGSSRPTTKNQRVIVW
jgi:hypothetical protein